MPRSFTAVTLATVIIAGAIAGSIIRPVGSISTPDFAITPSSDFLSLPQGAAGNVTITVSSLNNYSGNVTLSTSVTPYSPFSFELVPARLSLSPSAQSSLATLSFSWKECWCLDNGEVTITAYGSLVGKRYALVEVVYRAFDLIIHAHRGAPPGPGPGEPCNVNQLAPNSTVTCYVNVVSPNGYTGNVTLSTVVSPPGPSVSLSSSRLQLTASAIPEVSLTISTNSAPIGSYEVTLTGADGYSSHSTQLALQIENPIVVSGPDYSIPILLATVSAAAVGIVLMAYLLRRLSRPPKYYWGSVS
jgi:hypothetical protein